MVGCPELAVRQCQAPAVTSLHRHIPHKEAAQATAGVQDGCHCPGRPGTAMVVLDFLLAPHLSHLTQATRLPSRVLKVQPRLDAPGDPGLAPAHGSWLWRGPWEGVQSQDRCGACDLTSKVRVPPHDLPKPSGDAE